MAAAFNPQMLLQMLQQQKGGGAGEGGDETSGASRELQGADPGYALQMVNQIKKKIADMLPTLAFKAPAAARSLMSSFKGLDSAIKELQQAQQTMQAVGGRINLSALPQSQGPGGTGAPDLMRSF